MTELREKWEKIYSDVFGVILTSDVQLINDNISLEELLSQFEVLFKMMEDKGKTFDYREGLLSMWIVCMVIFRKNEKVSDSFRLMEKKRKLYGNKPLEITGDIGLVVRVIAKLCRLINMEQVEYSKDSELGESVSDTKMDIFNYAIIGFEMTDINYDIEKLIEMIKD